MGGGVRRATLAVRVVAAMLLVASTLVWVSGSMVGAWSSNDGAVLVLEDVLWPEDMAADSSGNVYITGEIKEDPYQGAADAFVSKVDSSGNVVWTKVFEQTPGEGWPGNYGDDRGTAVAVDSSDNLYVTGYYQTTVDFDPNEGTEELTASSGYDIFVVKLDSSGDLVWAKSVGTNGSYERSTGIAVDSSGNVHVTGRFYSANLNDFDPGDGTVSLPYLGNWSNLDPNMFVLKLDSSGNYVWAKSMGGTDPTPTAGASPEAVAVDSSGNVYTTGSFPQNVDFDPNAGIEKLSSNGNADVFVSKLDSSGNHVWAKAFGSTLGHRLDKGSSLALDSSGNVHVVGEFVGTVDFDPGVGTVNLTPVGEQQDGDVFVLKLDSSGNYVWAKRLGGNSYDSPYSVAVDSSGNVHTSGFFRETADFDPNAGTEELTSAGTNDVFVSKLDSSGNYVWAKSISSTHSLSAAYLAIDSSGNVYHFGLLPTSGLTVDFDPGAGTLNVVAEGQGTWVSKLDSSGNLAPADNPGFTLSTTSVSVSEAGSTDSFTVVLDAQPASDVVLSVTSSDTGEVTVAPAQVTFTSGNWSTAQTITVAGVDDDLTDGNQTATVTVSVVDGSSADAFDPLADQTVAVTNADDDSFGLSVVQSDGSTGTTESGGTDS